MTKPIVLFLDDELGRRDKFHKEFENDAIITFVDNPADAIREIRTKKWDKIFLDHDLGHFAMTGKDVAACFFQSQNCWAEVFIHSANPAGADNMVEIFKNLNVSCEVCCIFHPDFWRLAREFIEG